MTTNNIRDFSGGFFVGNFLPNLIPSQHIEIGHHKYPKGYVGPAHYHELATEINYIVRGRIIANGIVLQDGDFFTYPPGEVADVEFLTDTDLIIIKTPSIPGDKILL